MGTGVDRLWMTRWPSGARRCLLSAVLPLALLSGCATLKGPDPFESTNRKIFAFNESIDAAFLQPVAQSYQKIVPSPVRTGVSNFFGNVRDVWSGLNLLLQGRGEEGFTDLMRFGTNSLFGVLGIFDVASDLGMERRRSDFGLTLGKWGVPAGPYLYFPVLGPSSIRDSVGLPVDLKASPENFVAGTDPKNLLTALRIVDTRASILQATGVLDDIALDKYNFIRDAYLQRRRNQVYDGNPPEEDDDNGGSGYVPTAPVPASAAASEPMSAAASAPASAASAASAP